MAEIRFNYGDKFTQTSDSNTGIGSTIPAGKLDVAGNTSAGSLRVSGIATLSSYQGFVNTKLSTTENLIVEAGNSGSVSGEVVIGTGQTISVSTGATTGQGGIQSLKVYETFMPPVGGTADRPTDVKPGMVYYNKDFKTIEFWDGNFWKQVDNTTRRGRGILAGGYDPVASASNQDHIGFINIASEGNALDFGNLISGRQTRAASSSTRGLIGCGYISPTGTNIIEYITMASAGNGIDFGDATIQRRNHAMLSSSTRAIMGGGESPSQTNVMDYVEIATLGNALDFGDLNGNRVAGGGMASPVRGIIHGNELTTTSQSDEVEMITIASKGNSVRFGSMDDSRRNCGSVSNGIRGLVAGGNNGTERISLISFCTMASEGDFVSFGDLSGGARDSGTGMCNSVRAIFTAGYPDHTIPLESINFASGGQAVTFGFDTIERGQSAGYCSDSHGGLGGF